MKPIVVFNGQCGMALEPKNWNWASSHVDFGYRELFRVAAMTSGSL